jgi:hypothetical protein
MEEIISGIIDSNRVEVLAKVFKEHPESSIISRSKRSRGNL